MNADRRSFLFNNFLFTNFWNFHISPWGRVYYIEFTPN